MGREGGQSLERVTLCFVLNAWMWTFLFLASLAIVKLAHTLFEGTFQRRFPSVTSGAVLITGK